MDFRQIVKRKAEKSKLATFDETLDDVEQFCMGGNRRARSHRNQREESLQSKKQVTAN